jgi:large subunit ribosomal protein L21
MFAVIKTGGKQYVIKEGDVLSIEKLDVEAGQKILFDEVLLIDADEQTLIGTPRVANAAVKAEVVKNFKDDKILVFKKKRRKQYRRTRGHRQPLTEVKVEKIYPDTTAVPAEELKIEAVQKAPAPVAEAPPVKAKRVPKPPKPKAEPVAKPKKKKAAKAEKKPKARAKKAAK